MASTSETGHARNMTSLESLITSITAFGPSYNPSKESIKIPALEAVLTTTKQSLTAVSMAQAAYSNAVAARETAFESFGKLVTRVNNALKASDTTQQVNESALTIVRKLQGRRAGAKPTAAQIKAFEAEGKEINQISTSQMSFDSRLENFDRLIQFLGSVPQYNPNEEDLKIESLTALYSDLKAKNSDVLTATVQLDNARIQRNEVMYKPATGLVYVAFDTKFYIKSVFGATSPYYKQVSKIEFKALDK